MTRRGLVDPEALAAQLESASPPVVLDLRQDPGDRRPVIPGAVHAGLHEGFAQHRPARHLHYDMPTPEEFAATMGRLGIAPDRGVVVTDDMGNRWATRVYWLLCYFGHRGPVAVLDGGTAAWVAASKPIDHAFRVPKVVTYPVPSTVDESIYASARAVATAVEAGTVTMCDVRTPDEYSGVDMRSGRGGHIPGAINIPWDDALADDGTFLPDGALVKVLAPFLNDAKSQVTYCQGGIRASLTWFVLHELLERPAKLYAASWEEWAQDRSLPVTLAN